MTDQKVYTLMPADVLTVTVPRPTTLTVNMEPSVELWDQVVTQTIEGLREELTTAKRTLGSQNAVIERLHDEVARLHEVIANERYQREGPA